MRASRRSVLVLALVGGAVLAGCGGEGNIDGDDRAAARADLANPASCDETAGWVGGTQEDQLAPIDSPVFDIDSQAGLCFDEIGFQIDTSDPVGYKVEYTDEAVGPDGAPLIRPVGDHLLLITVNARAAETLNSGQAVKLEGDVERYRIIQSAVLGGRVGNQSIFVLGLRNEVPYAVSATSGRDVSHVVVRLAHPPAA